MPTEPIVCDESQDGTSSVGNSEPPIPHDPPDGGVQGWSMVACVVMIFAHTPGIHYIYGVLYSQLLDHFDAGRGMTAGVGASATCVMFVAAVASGWLQQRFSARFSVMLGSVIASAGLVLSATVTELWQLYLTYGLIMGFGHALTFPPGPVIISQWFTKNAGVACGIGTAGAGLGTVYLGLLAQWVSEQHGWRATFLVLGCLDLVGLAVPGFFLVPPPTVTLVPPPTAAQSSTERDMLDEAKLDDGTIGVQSAMASHVVKGNSDEGTSPPVGPAAVVQVSRNRAIGCPGNHGAAGAEGTGTNGAGPEGTGNHGAAGAAGTGTNGAGPEDLPEFSFCALWQEPSYRRFRAFCGSILIHGFAWWVPVVHTVRYIQDKGYSSNEASALVVYMGAGTVIGRVLLMWLSDRWSRSLVYVCNEWLQAVANVAVVMMSAYVGLAIYCFISGWTMGLYIAMITPLTQQLAGTQHLAQTSSLSYSITGIGSVIGPVLAGVLYERFGTYDYSYLGCAALQFTSGLWLLLSLECCSSSYDKPTTHHLQEQPRFAKAVQ